MAASQHDRKIVYRDVKNQSTNQPTSVVFVEFTSEFCVKVSQVVHISATAHQKTFIYGPHLRKLPLRVGIQSMTPHARVHAHGLGLEVNI